MKGNNPKNDIENKRDFLQLVQSFYSELLEDPELGEFFAEVVELDLEKHVPHIASFWSSVVLGEMSYRGNVMLKHIELNNKKEIRSEHFDRWLEIWTKHVDSLFEGDKAEATKNKANMMMQLMKVKIRQSEKRGFIQ